MPQVGLDYPKVSSANDCQRGGLHQGPYFDVSNSLTCQAYEDRK